MANVLTPIRYSNQDTNLISMQEMKDDRNVACDFVRVHGGTGSWIQWRLYNVAGIVCTTANTRGSSVRMHQLRFTYTTNATLTTALILKLLKVLVGKSSTMGVSLYFSRKKKV
jgi:hypothetical protein